MNKELSEVLVGNLIRNAIMHSQRGDTIELKLNRQSLRVCNPGKAALDGARIFERFYKSDQSTGKGLGLAIVKKIITDMSGTISVESKLGKGTTFHIDLPAREYP